MIDPDEIRIDAEQARRELRLVEQACVEMENAAIEKLLKTQIADNEERSELICLANVIRSIPNKLRAYIDTEKLHNHDPYEEQ